MRFGTGADEGSVLVYGATTFAHVGIDVPRVGPFGLMAALGETDDEIDQTFIAELTLKDKHNVSRILMRLEASGWIERTPDPTDARAQLNRSTEKGRRYRDEVRRTLYAHFAHLDLGWSETEQDTLIALLKQIRRHAEPT